jgi:hypothetical protein
MPGPLYAWVLLCPLTACARFLASDGIPLPGPPFIDAELLAKGRGGDQTGLGGSHGDCARLDAGSLGSETFFRQVVSASKPTILFNLPKADSSSGRSKVSGRRREPGQQEGTPDPDSWLHELALWRGDAGRAGDTNELLERFDQDNLLVDVDVSPSGKFQSPFTGTHWLYTLLILSLS